MKKGTRFGKKSVEIVFSVGSRNVVSVIKEEIVIDVLSLEFVIFKRIECLGLRLR